MSEITANEPKNIPVDAMKKKKKGWSGIKKDPSFDQRAQLLSGIIERVFEMTDVIPVALLQHVCANSISSKHKAINFIQYCCQGKIPGLFLRKTGEKNVLRPNDLLYPMVKQYSVLSNNLEIDHDRRILLEYFAFIGKNILVLLNGNCQ